MSWWLMGGYAPYVWGAYALVCAVLGLLWCWSYRRLKSQLKGKG